MRRCSLCTSAVRNSLLRLCCRAPACLPAAVLTHAPAPHTCCIHTAQTQACPQHSTPHHPASPDLPLPATPCRWVSNPASRLHSPALHRQLLGLMQKLFLQLLAELKKLGATVVSASFHSITLCTGKRSLPAAVGYVK